ncbi:hypothetical protein Pmar_PMAR026869 [Perkinsus marinus ATCC 50983]|uniref:NHL repeat-containing protein n=1 Tax=Perkinsus marinus (strain ATCC 50983 / TXsc) TaxID=423536 RepID=C5KPD6_PERM5|nr:hypothetical protein Pmar_PMAR026869 [Perkinsus marinus ATCC 50983]EER13657.1 hypothetical protein Pmar_PMAR026869 [Perkinsus marinus ATCC 50983]|eukprot:XP_002781862.1 hypothetical protein Pmar_PMAR026869 [Perkinsus marinus ATCC 50983]
MPIDMVPNEDAGYAFLVDWGSHRVVCIDEGPPRSTRNIPRSPEEAAATFPYPPSMRVIAGKGERGSSLAHLAEPMNAVEFEDEIYIADRGNNRVVAWPSDGSGTMGRLVSGSNPGSGMCDLYAPASCEIDRTRKILYVADTGNQRVMAYEISSSKAGRGPLEGNAIYLLGRLFLCH